MIIGFTIIICLLIVVGNNVHDVNKTLENTNLILLEIAKDLNRRK
jgi:uncharacterized protein YoxC